MPTCVQAPSRQKLMENVKVFSGFYDKIPPKCQKPNNKDIKECLDTIHNSIKKESPQMKASLESSIHAIFEMTRSCIREMRAKVKDLDKYVLSGCED